MSNASNDRGPSVVRTGGEVGCLPPGYQLREFVIDAVLGEGGFGVVYAATDTRLERRVAIKEYMPTSLATRDVDFSVHARSSADHREAFGAGLRSFINEAKLLARFEHPSLVKVYQFWEERGTAYMVMPLYTAPNFKKWIKQRTRPVEEAWLVSFLDGLIDALDVLHKENCLHRDVAPDNVLVLNDATPLLLDFGAARRVIGDMTHNLTVILKPGFAPVEQYAETSALKQGPWTDVYALSAVGYFAISGKAPAAAVGRMVNDELVPLRELAAGRYSQRLLSALDAGLRVRPEERPLSMQALRAYLFGEATPDDKTTVVMSKPAAPLSPAPAALHSTFKPKTNAPIVDEDATQVMTNAPAKKPPTQGAAAAPSTVSRSAAPTMKLPPRQGAPAGPAAPVSAESVPPGRKRSNALIWGGSVAGGGAALVLGAVWLFGGSDAPTPAKAPQVTTEVQPSPPAPIVEPATAPTPAPPPVAVAPTPVPAPAPAPVPAPAPAPVQTAPAPPPPVAKPAPAPSPAQGTSSAQQPKQPATAGQRPGRPSEKPAPPPPAAKPPETTKVTEAKPVETKPDVASGPRAPEGSSPPLAVTDNGITALQIPGTVNTDEKAPKFAAFTCCNLHFSGDWVSDYNYSGQERIPAGSPITIVDYGRWRLMTEINGKKYRIGLDYGRSYETLAQFARKLTVDKDLRFRLASFPPIVQDAIRAGKVMPGMTKEQVVIAVGFPPRDQTPSVNEPSWKMWHTSRIQYTIHFDDRGRVKDIEIDPDSRANVVFGVPAKAQ